MRLPFGKIVRKLLGWMVKAGLDEAQKEAEKELAKRLHIEEPPPGAS